MKPNDLQGAAERRRVLRLSAGFVAVVAGVALCIRAGASALIPFAFLIALLPLERTKSSRQYILTLSVCVGISITIGIVYAVLAHKSALTGILLSCGLIFVSIGRLKGPASSASDGSSD